MGPDSSATIDRGTISLSPHKIKDTIEVISTFVSRTGGAPLSEWQKVAGQISWLLDLIPMARPALAEFFREVKGASPNKFIHFNETIKSNLSWLLHVLPTILDVPWEDQSADIVMYCDATLSLGISFNDGNKVFLHRIRSDSDRGGVEPDIFFMKEMGVLFALSHASTQKPLPRRLIIHCDNMNTVQAFEDMYASDVMHTAPLLADASIAFDHGIDFRVRYIEREKNAMADLISCLNFTEFNPRFKRRVHTFSPPATLLPDEWKLY